MRACYIILVVSIGLLVACSELSEESEAEESEDLAVVAVTVQTAPTSTVITIPTPATPPLDVILRDMVFCQRLRVDKGMLWGQSPTVIHSGDPRVTGELKPGDYIRLLGTRLTDEGALRVQVYPHDYRAVGQSEDKVWITVDTLITLGLYEDVFTCEDR